MWKMAFASAVGRMMRCLRQGGRRYLPPAWKRRLKRFLRISPSNDLGCSALGAQKPEEILCALQAKLPVLYDLLCFSLSEDSPPFSLNDLPPWLFRQAAKGHRVFVFTLSESLAAGYQLEALGKGVSICRVPSNPEETYQALEQLRRDQAICDAVCLQLGGNSPTKGKGEQLGRSWAEQQGWPWAGSNLGWDERPGFLERQIRRACERVSIIILTRNRLSLTRLCITSVLKHTAYPHYELIVVDNDSRDGTKEYLKEMAREDPRVRPLFNDRNEGFARANNQGLLAATGEYIVLLNNDTIVMRGWLSRLLQHLKRDVQVGMVGPVTNCVANEAMIPIHYESLEELETLAERRLWEQEGRSLELEMLGMFCVLLRRRLIEEAGLLDERFGMGTFEDDDYSYRVRRLGYKLICAEDVFVHHFGRGTMRGLGDEGYLKLFEENRKRYERKWGVRWRPQPLRF